MKFEDVKNGMKVRIVSPILCSKLKVGYVGVVSDICNDQNNFRVNTYKIKHSNWCFSYQVEPVESSQKKQHSYTSELRRHIKEAFLKSRSVDEAAEIIIKRIIRLNKKRGLESR